MDSWHARCVVMGGKHPKAGARCRLMTPHPLRRCDYANFPQPYLQTTETIANTLG